jgi:hypothetical protein
MYKTFDREIWDSYLSFTLPVRPKPHSLPNPKWKIWDKNIKKDPHLLSEMVTENPCREEILLIKARNGNNFFFSSPSTLNCVFENWNWTSFENLHLRDLVNWFEIVTRGMLTTRADSLEPRKGCALLVYEGTSEYERKRCHVVCFTW